jgi:hypothetical protein
MSLEAITSCEAKPTAPIVKVELPAGTVNLKAPLASALTPALEPFTLIEAPGTGAPESSVTLPETTVCAIADIIKKAKAQKLNSSFFLMLVNFLK